MKMTEDLEFDSIMIVELVTKVEDEYGIEFDSFAELIEAFDTVGSVINEDSAIEKNVEEVWNSQTGQIDIMEQQTYLHIYCFLQCYKFPKYDED